MKVDNGIIISEINKKIDFLLDKRKELKLSLDKVNFQIDCAVKTIKLYETEMVNSKQVQLNN